MNTGREAPNDLNGIFSLVFCNDETFHDTNAVITGGFIKVMFFIDSMVDNGGYILVFSYVSIFCYFAFFQRECSLLMITLHLSVDIFSFSRDTQVT